MLITISIADFKIANHYTDPTAKYVSSLKLSAITTKKGIATDSFKFTIEKSVLDYMDESFAYLCYDTIVNLYVDNKLVINGYIDKLNTSSTNVVSFDIMSIMKWQLSQFMAPSISGLCQNQIYSENCTLAKEDFDYVFTTVEVNCFTGAVSLDLLGGAVTLGGNTGIGNPIFLDRSMWWNAIIIINGKYKTTVTNVTDTDIYLAINYLDLTVLTVSLSVYLKCDKTYGECYSRFSNTRNFWGFANTGRKAQTFDIFSASELHYCGEDLVNQDDLTCITDYNLFGVDLNG